MIRAALFCALFARAAFPATQAELEANLAQARAQWGINDPSVTIRFERLNGCHTHFSRVFVAWSDFKTRAILINSACNWDRNGLLSVTVLHEYGHMLTGPQHSDNKHSVMYFMPSADQIITPEDRTKLQLCWIFQQS